MDIYIKASIPEASLEEWLQYVRAFDTNHGHCRFEMEVQSERLTTSEVEKLFDRINLPFRVRKNTR